MMTVFRCVVDQEQEHNPGTASVYGEYFKGVILFANVIIYKTVIWFVSGFNM